MYLYATSLFLISFMYWNSDTYVCLSQSRKITGTVIFIERSRSAIWYLNQLRNMKVKCINSEVLNSVSIMKCYCAVTPWRFPQLLTTVSSPLTAVNSRRTAVCEQSVRMWTNADEFPPFHLWMLFEQKCLGPRESLHRNRPISEGFMASCGLLYFRSHFNLNS